MSDPHKEDAAAQALDTRLTRTGKSPAYFGGTPVNAPLVRASTVLFDSVAAMRDTRARRSDERAFSYGARGTPTTFALEDAVSELEGAYRTRLFPTGLAAIGMVLLSYLKPGDHVLMSDSVYEPARNLAHSFLAPYGIRSSFFAADGSGIEDLFEPATRLVYAECPGSLVYEMCDLPKLAALTHARGALLAADNTWGSGVQYRPLALGADISTMAATKYLSGHSDVMLGTVATTREAWQPLNERCDAFGMTVSPDDAWLVLRGMRTLSARLQMHERHALEVAHWLQARPEVAAVFCPALPRHPGHDIWQRDCRGTNGLLSFEFKPGIGNAAVERFVDALSLFGRGSSWGGYESLVAWTHMRAARSVTDWSARGAVVRLHIGLEAPADLLADLAQAFTAAKA
ncbi:cystathionine beta-lyase [Verminephrobacter eiseniae]|uniref:Cystathionine beta-lyase n=1 Tax=Verminephrobacter eiseniae (strain EF01-2) TaxID=391735 RepID=A1WQD2_VEREI|nr:cystathionine beta-lyase [Verminephrobacter eiseniae]ABM59839.1 cystathionine beta-lyase [Verminephrobacter eiseniae EF01-2]MCW5285351.1 cystathionine beta-lyase [Verminephrobacter eiseniae]MCW5303058.1 cystathionine beta-lyase [Verminephrobacter eiseniae]MCW8182671.1 cystathionine beta-lyase [Verminephrobacter eiseniae]MCW8192472.1 cystathionine beta-lyase [Verminephrobacter eiseniae]